MVKKVVLIFIAVLLQYYLNGQTIYYTNLLNNSVGWQYDGNWNFTSGKLKFNYAPIVTNFDFSATSPEIVLAPNTQTLIVNQYLYVWTPSVTNEKAEIKLIVNGTEHLLWQHSLSNGDWGGAAGSDLILPITAFAGQTVKLKFCTFGANTDAWNYWNIYEFSIAAQFDNDVAIQNIYGPKHINPHQTGSWQVNIKNLGSEPVNGFSVKLINHKTDQIVAEVVDATLIAAGDSKNVNLSFTPDTIFNTILYAVVEAQNDEYINNNRSKSAFLRVFPPNYLNIYVWDKDNDIATIEDPETFETIQPDEALTKIMDSVGIIYEKGQMLPEFVEDYDVIFVTTGPYCYS